MGHDGGDLPSLELRYDELLARSLPSAAALADWLRDESDLQSRIAAEGARRYIRMTRDTANENARAAYLAFEREVMPRVRVLSDELDRKFLQCLAVADSDPQRYGVLVRLRRTRSEIFRPENTVLQREETELQAKQRALVGGLTVEFDGRKRTLQQLTPYLENQDRDLRERAFRAGLAARRTTWPELEDIYDRLVALRTQVARNAGHAEYTSFRFLELGRFDYAPADCARLHEAVALAVVPALRELSIERSRKLGIERLRSWDLEVDPTGRPPFHPFADEAGLVDLCRRVFARIDPRFEREFSLLVDRGLLDLMSREGKAPGGHQCTLQDERVPFIFANAVGLHRVVRTLLHEGGHAFHALLARDDDLLAYRVSPGEFAETASMSMELLGLENLTGAYSEDDAGAARREHLESVLRLLPWIASIDAFQHWVYGNPDHDRAARREAWLAIRARFDPDLDWSGIEDDAAMQWIAQTHLFSHPFYYVEYAIAQIAALQRWRNYRRDPAVTVESYRRALALGGSRPLPALFATAGVRFDPSAELLGELVPEVMTELRTLPAG